MQQESETTTENKLTSRKFIVWIIWSIIALAVIVMGFIRSNDEIILKTLEYYSVISVIYIGGNVATKGIKAKFGGETT